jgi:hypothetical protein
VHAIYYENAWAEVVWFADHERLRLPDAGGRLLFAHATSTLPLLLGCLARTPLTLLEAFIALAFDTVFDGAHPVEDELMHVLEDVKDTQLMLDVSPGALQSVFVKRRAIGHRVIQFSYRGCMTGSKKG